ncbi:MAG: hypothetical protein Fur0024_3580 [Patescibacteria group bacterium]
MKKQINLQLLCYLLPVILLAGCSPKIVDAKAPDCTIIQFQIEGEEGKVISAEVKCQPEIIEDLGPHLILQQAIMRILKEKEEVEVEEEEEINMNLYDPEELILRAVCRTKKKKEKVLLKLVAKQNKDLGLKNIIMMKNIIIVTKLKHNFSSPKTHQ